MASTHSLSAGCLLLALLALAYVSSVSATCGVFEVAVGTFTFSGGDAGNINNYAFSFPNDNNQLSLGSISSTASSGVPNNAGGSIIYSSNGLSYGGSSTTQNNNWCAFQDYTCPAGAVNVALLITMEWPGDKFYIQVNGNTVNSISSNFQQSQWALSDVYQYGGASATFSKWGSSYNSGVVGKLGSNNNVQYGLPQYLVPLWAMVGTNFWNCGPTATNQIQLSISSGTLPSTYTSGSWTSALGRTYAALPTATYTCTQSNTYTFKDFCPIPSSTAPVAPSSSGAARPSSSTGIRRVSSTATNGQGPSLAVGDPQFRGFLGQDYQVHGTSGDVYNLISTPSLQMNALFDFRTEGACPASLKARTLCYSHPGNYFQSVGMLFALPSATTLERAEHYLEPTVQHASKELAPLLVLNSASKGKVVGASNVVLQEHMADLVVESGAYDVGMLAEWNAVEIEISNEWQALSLSSPASAPLGSPLSVHGNDAAIYVLRPNNFTLYVISNEVVVRLENSDYFINYHEIHLTCDLKDRMTDYTTHMRRSKHDPASVDEHEHSHSSNASSTSLRAASSLSSDDFPHGLLGQTWQHKVYKNVWKYIEGTSDDYIVQDGLLGSDFFFNHFGEYRAKGHRHTAGQEAEEAGAK